MPKPMVRGTAILAIKVASLLAALAGASLAMRTLPIAGLSVMLFDAPAAQASARVWAMFGAAVACPVLAIVATVVAARNVKRATLGSLIVALVCASVPFLALIYLYHWLD